MTLLETGWFSCSLHACARMIQTHEPVSYTHLDVYKRQIYYLKLGKGKNERKVFSSNSFNKYPFCKENILFMHAMTGCDTTSCFHNKGKNSIFKSFEIKSKKNPELTAAVQVFSQPNQSHEIILKSGHICLLNIYNASQKVKDINESRYISFTKAVVKKRAVNLATLPPTADAAKYHFFRVYSVSLYTSFY